MLIWFSYLGMLPSQLTYFLAINYGNAPTATVMQCLGPIFIIIYLALTQLTWPQKINIISILLAVCGTFLLVTNGHFNSLSLSPLALLWKIGAGLSQASYTLLPGKLLTKYDPRLVVGWAMLLGNFSFITLYSILSTASTRWVSIGKYFIYYHFWNHVGLFILFN